MAWSYAAGASGTVTVPDGGIVLAIRAESQAANGTCAIFGGTAIPVVGNSPAGATQVMSLQFPSRPARQSPVASGTGAAAQIVFANTVSYYVEYTY